MTVKSFNCEGCRSYCYGGYHMEEASEFDYGDYVRREDYDVLSAMFEKMREELSNQYGTSEDQLDVLNRYPLPDKKRA